MCRRTGAALGDFDFVICTDKTAAQRHRHDLDKKLLGGFVAPASAVRSYPSLALMAATHKTSLAFDSLLLEEHPSFSWLARDDSKPGRRREDQTECWVAHAAPGLTKRLLDSYREGRVANVRAAIVSDLLPQFKALLADLSAQASAPEVLMAQGHRWGAAFPVAPFDPTAAFYLDREHAFAACGDYFSPVPGRVEGAWMSGSSLAEALLADGLS